MSRQRKSNMQTGFTLVEVIISTGLGAVLLVGLWTVFDIFSALHQRAGTQSLRAQLTRGLLHQLQDDLNRVPMPAIDSPQELANTASTMPATGSISAGLETTRTNDREPNQSDNPIAFHGSDSWLILDLPRPADSENMLAPPAHLDTQDPGTIDTGSIDTVPTSRRVIYQFVPPELAILRDSVAAGLTRWELSDPPPGTRELIAELERGEWGAPNSIVWLTTDSPAIDMNFLAAAPHKDSRVGVEREEVPEIERFLFRYFDGSRWQTTWDGHREGSLPRAVECLVVWRADDDADDVPGANDAAPQVETREPAEIRQELDDIRLLDAWNNLGEQDFSATPAALPNGFARYVFCLPAALPPHRQLSDMPDVLATGER